MHSNVSRPTKAVCYREVFTIRGVCYKRFLCIYLLTIILYIAYANCDPPLLASVTGTFGVHQLWETGGLRYTH